MNDSVSPLLTLHLITTFFHSENELIEYVQSRSDATAKTLRRFKRATRTPIQRKDSSCRTCGPGPDKPPANKPNKLSHIKLCII